jgi:hypothetical protein
MEKKTLISGQKREIDGLIRDLRRTQMDVASDKNLADGDAWWIIKDRCPEVVSEWARPGHEIDLIEYFREQCEVVCPERALAALNWAEQNSPTGFDGFEDWRGRLMAVVEAATISLAVQPNAVAPSKKASNRL